MSDPVLICETIYDKLVESRLVLFRAVQSRLPDRPQAEINEAVVKLLFRIMFIRFAEDRLLLPKAFLAREIIERSEQDRKWGREATLYGYVQQYYAWLGGRSENPFGIYPYGGALFDADPLLDDPQLRIDDSLLRDVLLTLSQDAMGRPIDYAQINPRILGNIHERFLGYVIEIKERRLDAQVGRDTRRKEGTFYTPQSVTRFLVEHAVDEALARLPGRKPWELVCLDPACGSGHFLVEYVSYVAARCEELDDRRSCQQWKRYVTQHGVFGVDKDSTAVMLTKLSLWINSAMRDEPFVTIDTRIKCGNSLAFPWEIEFAEVFEERGGFDIVVGNPPWGADLTEIREYLDSGPFALARGQYDSYELFIELGRRLLRERGMFGFIIPDSITLPEHEPLRRMLLDQTALDAAGAGG